MTWIAVGVIGAGALAGGLASYFGSREVAGATEKAANTVADATKEANETQKTEYDQQRKDLEPWRNAGVNALSKLEGEQFTPFGMDQFQADPGYAFRLTEGMKALERSAAARGGLLSGATLKGVQDFGQGLASQEYQNAFTRYQMEREARLNNLRGLAGIGQTAVGQMGQASQNYANNSGNLTVSGANALAQGYVGAANARASGYLGMANSLNSAIGGYYNHSQGQAILNRLAPPPTNPSVQTVQQVPTGTVPTHYTGF